MNPKSSRLARFRHRVAKAFQETDGCAVILALYVCEDIVAAIKKSPASKRSRRLYRLLETTTYEADQRCWRAWKGDGEHCELQLDGFRWDAAHAIRTARQ